MISDTDPTKTGWGLGCEPMCSRRTTSPYLELYTQGLLHVILVSVRPLRERERESLNRSLNIKIVNSTQGHRKISYGNNR